MAETILFKKRTTECCLVYNYKKQLMGEIRKRRINFYKQWVFQPNTIQKMGRVWFTHSFLKQINEMITVLKRRGFCVEDDMTDEKWLVAHKIYLEVSNHERKGEF